MKQLMDQFVSDAQLQAVLVLVFLDLVLGVTAAAKTGTFAFSKVSGFLRDDVLGKVLPWGCLYAAWKWAPDVSVLGVDMEVLTRATGVVAIAALAGSLVSSLADLGVSVPNPLARGEHPDT